MAKNNFEDLTGREFGKWTVIKHLGMRKSCEYYNTREKRKQIMTTRYYLCKCECGLIKEITAGNLKSKMSTACKSCGIYNEDSRTHHPLNSVYGGMVQRCTNKNTIGYKDYGGRGIKVCDRWLGEDGFKNFAKDMGKTIS